MRNISLKLGSSTREILEFRKPSSGVFLFLRKDGRLSTSFMTVTVFGSYPSPLSILQTAYKVGVISAVPKIGS